MKTRLVGILGSGGVGKTTTTAAMGLELARRGHNVVAITVDPAKRLAQVLGLNELTNYPQEIWQNDKSKFSALWLEPNSALRELIYKYVPQKEKADAILNHRLFKILQSQLGGIEDYLAVEKLLELRHQGEFDYCILDTPPSRHALDFLESPKHLLKFLDESVLRFFLKDRPQNMESGFFKRILNSGAEHSLGLFKKFLGLPFLDELKTLLDNLAPIHKVFEKTAAEVEDWIRDSESKFCVVSLADQSSAQEAAYLSEELKKLRNLGANYWIVNRCFPEELGSGLELQNHLSQNSFHFLLALLKRQDHYLTQIRTILAKEIPVACLGYRAPSKITLQELQLLGKEILSQCQTL